MESQNIPTKNNSVKDQITTLFEELQLAKNWQRPSILLAAYHSKLVLLDAQTQLEKKLHKLKQSIYRLEVTKDNYDIPLFLSQYPNREQTIFYISGLQNGGGTMDLNAYRALNMRRELLVDYQIRAVFWLTEDEADGLPKHALDFWSFRHRMVELNVQPSPKRIVALIKALNWPEWVAVKLSKEIPNGISLREELLKEIPDGDQAPAIRAELIHMLAGLHWANKDYNEAKRLLEFGLLITKKNLLYQLESRYYASIGLVSQSMGLPQEAIEGYQTSLKLDPTDALAWGNLGQTYLTQKLYSESLEATKKSIELDPKAAVPWEILGDLLLSSSKFDNAIQAYQNSLAIDSKDALLWVKLGDTFIKLNRPSDALIPYKKAKQLNIKDAETWIRLGTVYRDIGLLNYAVRALYKASRLEPLNATPWKILGNLYRDNNRIKTARKAYKTAQALDSQDKMVISALESCYTRKKKAIPAK